MNIQLSHKRRRPVAEINVVPYIDVMLVLLVIFMITAPLLSQGINVDLPKANAQQLKSEEKEPIIVSIDAQGHYYLNIHTNPEENIDSETIFKRVALALQTAKKEGNKQAVLVKGDTHVNYGKVVEIMALLQQAGADNVGLITESPDKQSH
ncbi:MAG: Tol-Pal system protein TolR [Legionellaceae bacterium]